MGFRQKTGAAVVGLLVVVTAGAARAQDEAAVQKMIDLNKQALADLESKSYDDAKDKLLEAIVVGKDAGLGTHWAMARTYLHLGALYVEGYKDKQKAMRQFALALKIRPDIKLTSAIATPGVTQAFDAAREDPNAAEAKTAEAKPAPAEPEEKAAPPPPPERKRARVAEEEVAQEEEQEEAPPPPPRKRRRGADEPDLPATIPTPLYCPNPYEAPPEEQIALRCVTRPDVQVARVLLFYRPPGTEKFEVVPSIRSPKGWYNASIPAKVVKGKLLQYYFEARDGADKPSGNAGRSDSPNSILIREGAPPVGRAGLAVRLKSGDGELSDENPLEEVEEEREREEREAGLHRRGPGSWFVGVGVGSGFGWHGERNLEYRKDLRVGAGQSLAGLAHLMPEIGYQISDSFAVVLQGRHQYIPNEGSGDGRVGAPASAAHAVLLRGLYLFGDGNFQAFLSGAVGGGEGFRLVIPPRPTPNDPSTSLLRSDTVRGGPVVVGPGAGIIYHFSKMLALNVEVKGLAGLPDFALVADVGGGLQVAF